MKMLFQLEAISQVILWFYGGKTIENFKYDAEGRLTLVDAITYIIEKKGR